MARLRMILGGRFRTWSDANLNALRASADLLTPDARRVMESFATARDAPVLWRLAMLRQSGVFRQTRKGQVALILAMLLKLI